MGKLTEYNYEALPLRVNDCLENTNHLLYQELKKIKGNTIITGVGGSKVVALFLAKVLEKKNKILCVVEDMGTLNQKGIEFFENIIIVTASGKTNGFKKLLEKENIKKYLFTANSKKKEDVTLLHYTIKDKEKSFVSLASTLIPIVLLEKYYQNKKYIFHLPKEKNYVNCLNENLPFDCLYDYDSKITAYFLETTFIEAGLEEFTLHEKYAYCHGRSTKAAKTKKNLIYLLSRKSELDTILLQNVSSLYDYILILQSNKKDCILDDFDLLKQAYLFVHQLSKITKKDLSKVKYAKIVPKIYHFKGEM